MRTTILAAAAVAAAAFMISPAVAADAGSGPSSEHTGPTHSGQPWYGEKSPSWGSTPCSDILEQPQKYRRGQVEYCRSAEGS